MKKKILAMVSFLVLFLLSFRFFFQTEGIIGHNWDWVFPSMNIFSEKLNILSIFTWNSYNLGEVVDLTIVHLFPASLFVLIGKLLGIKTLLFLLFFSVVFVSFISFKKLLDFLLGKSFLNYIPSFLYAYSPFLFNDIIGGAWVMWVSYSLCPIYFVFALKYLKTNGIKYLLLSLLTSIFIIVSFQNFVLINLLVLLYLIYEIIVVKNEKFKNIVNKLFIFSILMILVNVYWILPFSYTFINFTHNVILLDGGIHAFDPIKNSTQSIWNIVNLGGYHDRNMYLYALPTALKYLFQLTVGLAWLVILRFFILEKNRIIRQKVIFWILSLLVFIIIVKGGNNPFSGFTLWLYYSFPLMKLFRSHLHLMLIPVLITPILLALSLSYFYKNLKFKKVVLAIFALIVVIWISGWWYNGDLGQKTLLAQKRDHIDFYRLPPELRRYYEGSQKDKLDYRSFFLPAVFSPIYLKTEYQNKAQGVQPEYLYLNKPTFTSESNKFADNVEISFCEETNFNYIRYLSLFSVKNIILRSDVYPLFTKSANCWDDDYVRTRLDSSVLLEKFLAGRYATAYKIKDDYYLPHFYIPQNIIYSDGGIENLIDIIDFKDYQIRSGIFLEKSKVEDNEILNRADEVMVKRERKDIGYWILDIEKRESLKNGVPFPHVEQKPGGLIYLLVLQKEKFEEWKVRKDPERLIEKKLYYTGKRMAEFEEWGKERDIGYWILDNYQKKMEETIEEVKRFRDLDSKDAVIKLKAYLEAHRSNIKQTNLDEELKNRIRKVFDELEDKIVGLEPKQDFSRLVYKFDIPKEGEYEIYVRDNDNNGSNGNKIVDAKKQILDAEDERDSAGLATVSGEISNIQSPVSNIQNNNWKLLETKYFPKGEQELILPFSGISENLVGENLRTKDYPPNSIYRISFDYKALQGGSFFVAEGKTGKTAETQLFSTGDKFRNFEMFFKSSSKVTDASIHLSISVAGERNLKVERIYQTEVMLKLSNQQSTINNRPIPRITFVKINPTKYRIKVEGAKEAYVLVFSESFHQGWKAYIDETQNLNLAPPSASWRTLATHGKSQNEYGEIVASYFNGEIREGVHRNIFLDRNTFETLGKKPLPEERHLLINGYANSWYVTPEDSTGREDYEVIIEFQPQRLFYIGLGVSLLSLLTLVGYLGYLGMEKIKKLAK